MEVQGVRQAGGQTCWRCAHAGTQAAMRPGQGGGEAEADHVCVVEGVAAWAWAAPPLVPLLLPTHVLCSGGGGEVAPALCARPVNSCCCNKRAQIPEPGTAVHLPAGRSPSSKLLPLV